MHDSVTPTSNDPRIHSKWTIPLFFWGLLLVHANYYLPFIADDALISLRYARRLVQGDGLTWTDGHPVEGYSNLMWILLVAPLHALGLDLVLATRILGALCMGAALIFVAATYLTPKHGAASLPGIIVGSLFFIGAAPVAVWTIGGLEQPLVAAAIAGVISLYWIAINRDFHSWLVTFTLSVLLGVLCLTRPDGPLFSIAIVGSVLFTSLLARRPLSWRLALRILVMPILLYGGQLIFRLAYYGEWVPNTALVKITPSSHHLFGGLSYVWKGVLSLSPASFLAFAFLGVGVLRTRSRGHFIPLLLLTLIWFSYLVVIGGDIFPAYRHFVPIIVVLTYALAEGTNMVWDKLDGRLLTRAVLLGSLIGIVSLGIFLQFKNPENRRAIEERWEWNGRSLGLTLKAAFSERRPLLAVTAAGCLPYWSELPSLDMLGLNDYYLPRHKPKGIGRGYLGHELGDGNYILQRAPDLIVFNVGWEPTFLSGTQLAASIEFHRDYAKMGVRTAISPDYTPLVWFRRDSSKIGLTRSKDRITIPGYLMNAFDHTTAFLDKGRLVAGVQAGHPIGVAIENMPHECKIEVLSRHSGRIEYRTENMGNSALIVLTTESAALLSVEGIIIKDLSGYTVKSSRTVARMPE